VLLLLLLLLLLLCHHCPHRHATAAVHAAHVTG
jgi:hypothetical protein